MPRLDRTVAERLLPIAGAPPSLINVPPGCAFHPRCAYEPKTRGRGRTTIPELVDAGGGHLVRCHLPVAERRRIWAQEVKPKMEGS